jgi:hypothetical protein
MDSQLTEAIELSQAVVNSRRSRPFAKTVHAFLHVLNCIPDSAASEWTHDSLKLLRDASEDVVAAIEQHLSEADEKIGAERQLAEAVYAIRKALEEIDRWERHFLRT